MRGAGCRAGHGAAVALPALVQEGIQALERGVAAAGLAFRAKIRQQPQRCSIRHRSLRDIWHRPEHLRRRRDRLSHQSVPASRPAFAPLQHPDNACGLYLAPLDAVRAGPGGDPTVPGEGPGVAGFFVAPQPHFRESLPQGFEHRHRIAGAQAQPLPARRQRGLKAFQTFGDKGPLPRRGIGQLPELGLGNVERQHGTLPGTLRSRLRLRQRPVVFDPQITLEPDDLEGLITLHARRCRRSGRFSDPPRCRKLGCSPHLTPRRRVSGLLDLGHHGLRIA